MLDIGRFMQDGVGKPSPIVKSVQPIFSPAVSSAASILINEVNVESSIVLGMGVVMPYYSGGSGIMDGVYLSDSTHVFVNANRVSACQLVVIEFDPLYIKSFQSGSVSTTTSGTTVAISPVNPAKCIVTCFSSSCRNDASPIIGGITAFDATSIFVRCGYSAARTTYWRILEFK